MKVYLFDVDGTLTKPRRQMFPEFANWFERFCQSHIVFLVSGSDMAKIEEQVPTSILKQCYGVFACAGAEYYVDLRCMYSKKHEFSAPLLDACREFVDASNYPVKTGRHIETRAGMLNVSTLGRNASANERRSYNEWDRVSGEREALANTVREMNLGYEVSCGGEISIDITPAGWNKSVVKPEVLKRFPTANIQFFGDRMATGGNDFPLACALEDGSGRHVSHHVASFVDTWNILNRDSGVHHYFKAA